MFFLIQFSFIDQKTSRTGLCISQSGLSVLLNHLDAHPELAKMLPAFAAEDVPFYEGQSGLQESPPKVEEDHSGIICRTLLACNTQ